ncbi:hypothetical protein J1781_13765, partial [Rahnella sp. C60]|uniref:hypothetical protein n=1 Tax=Rahnella perminowiae TaxID=2816244 RepID=UPI001C270402
LRAKTICSSVNRDFFIGTTSVQGSVYHAGILFLNGAGFWVRVKRSPIIHYSPHFHNIRM